MKGDGRIRGWMYATLLENPKYAPDAILNFTAFFNPRYFIRFDFTAKLDVYKRLMISVSSCSRYLILHVMAAFLNAVFIVSILNPSVDSYFFLLNTICGFSGFNGLF